MKKSIIVALMIIAVCVLAWLLYPKSVGGPMCGPVCPSQGLHTWSRGCLGYVYRDNSMMDSYSDGCIGLPIGEKRCYGVPFGTEGMNIKDTIIDCSYPCNDKTIRQGCASVYDGNMTFQGLTVSCKVLRQRCDWQFAEV